MLFYQIGFLISRFVSRGNLLVTIEELGGLEHVFTQQLRDHNKYSETERLIKIFKRQSKSVYLDSSDLQFVINGLLAVTFGSLQIFHDLASISLQPETMKPQDTPCYTMLLAPFQPATRIELETNINTSIECRLNIRNTCDRTLHVIVTKTPAPERRITLTSSELNIPGNDTGVIHIKWTPNEAGCWRDVLQVMDSRRVKYDIHIATIAKSVKNSNRPQKKVKQPSTLLSSFLNIAAPTDSKRVQRNESIPTLNEPLVIHAGARQHRPKYETDLNKENICIKNSEDGELLEKNDRVNRNHRSERDKAEKILSEQNVNVWNDGSILPQVLLPSNGPQDSRRVTYVKERKPCVSVLYEHDEREAAEDATCDKPQSDFSMLLDKFTLASVNETSPRTAKRESIESFHADQHRTFNVTPGRSYVISVLSPSKTDTKAVNALSQSAGVYNLSPIKFDGLSLANGIRDIISSSPIAHPHGASKDTCEYSKRLAIDTTDRSVQTTPKECFTFEVIPEEREAKDTYIEISPPKKHLLSRVISASVTKLSDPRTGRVVATTAHDGEKMLYIKNVTPKRKYKKLSLSDTPRRKNTPFNVTKLSLNALRHTKWHSSSFRDSTRIERRDEFFAYGRFELDPFAPSVTEDPFLKKVGHYDEEWMLRQELVFTKWLNALLSSPEDLSVDIETAVADVGKVWQSCKALKDNLLAETKEVVSARYHTNTRLNTLRKAASAMYARDEIAKIFSSISEYIARGTLSIRPDRNLQRDIGLQKLILGLFLSYNPLWLRIGLETVYGESIPLRSNNDIIGLTRFLLTRFFSDPRLTKMPGYHKTNPSQKFVTTMNQFILKKFLFLIYFLDYAKQHKLIGHDPCLFHKRAECKESRSILLSFSRETLSGVGDVTKMLRGHDYVLTHKQTCIEEYDYAVTDIRHDLRDGVRLCRAMELITGARGLTQRCRVPAISRLQKVHNVDVALNALRDAGYVLEGDIDAKSIADGHCEKTLSLLWQIIHKYQAPRFDRSARVLQRWWRARLWYIHVRDFLRARKNLAALTIQRAWRRRTTSSWREVNCDLEERKKFLRVKTTAITIQRWWRIQRCTLQEAKKRCRAVVAIQRRWRASLLMRVQRSEFLRVRNATLTIQARWRATRAMKAQRSEYRACRNAAARIQSWWRSRRSVREQREQFLRKRESARLIQSWWRRYLLMRRAHTDFLRMKVAVRVIERWWTGVLDRKKFLRYREAVVAVQRAWRSHRARKRETACLKIQTWWRAAVCSREYNLRKSSCVRLQRWWRGVILTRRLREEFLRLRDAALVLQKNWRARRARRRYLERRRAASLIQSWYRRAKLARAVRRRYLETRTAAIRVQILWRGVKRARADRQRYLRQRDACVTLQSWWRMIKQRNEYRKYKTSVLVVQRRWRAVRAARAAKRERVQSRAAVVLQAHWRGSVARRRYVALRDACITLQSWWRMIQWRNEYRKHKTSVLAVQRRWRAVRAARAAKKKRVQSRAAVVLQAHWRGSVARRRYVALRQAAVVIQSHYRMKVAARRYRTVKRAALTIQVYWRAYVACKRERSFYLSLRRTVIALQRRFRQNRAVREELHRQQREKALATKIRDECGDAIVMLQEDTTSMARKDSVYWQEMISAIRSCSDLGVMKAYLNNLDTITKLSPTVRIILCEVNLADDIYNMIAQNNRSLPWMTVCLGACSILITLAKDSDTRNYITKKEHALTLVKLLNVSLKHKDVFLHCATLIWLLSQDKDYCKTLATCPQIIWLLQNIQQKMPTKFQKVKPTENKSDKSFNTIGLLFTDVNCAIAAVIKNICDANV